MLKCKLALQTRPIATFTKRLTSLTIDPVTPDHVSPTSKVSDPYRKLVNALSCYLIALASVRMLSSPIRLCQRTKLHMPRGKLVLLCTSVYAEKGSNRILSCLPAQNLRGRDGSIHCTSWNLASKITQRRSPRKRSLCLL